MNEYLWVGIVGIIVHFALVGAAYGVAKGQDRHAPLFWAAVAMITGPLALLLLFIWRTDRGLPPESPTPDGRPGQKDAHSDARHSPKSPKMSSKR